MLNHEMDSVVLVKGWKRGANWSFPRGKINKDEADLDCAVREVYEETGLDLRAAGLVPTEKKPKYIEISMREQQLRLYVFRDVPMDTNFQPRTRKEISKIQWYKLSDLPAFRKKGSHGHDESNNGPSVNKFYMVAPFLVPLKKWITSQKKIGERRDPDAPQTLPPHHLTTDEIVTTEDDAWVSGTQQQAAQIPAIETLDGATRELQRLLKMQPPTQGIQPQLTEDQGPALLSILQSNARPNSAPQASSIPQPKTLVEGPQPDNVHHMTNQPQRATDAQKPPLPFLYNQSQAPYHSGPAHPGQLHHALQPHAALSREQLGQMNPHPEHSRTSIMQSTAPSNISHSNPSVEHDHGIGHAQSSLSSVSSQLSGPSLALLNAFKRDVPVQDTSYPDTGPLPGKPNAAYTSPYMPQNLPGTSIDQLISRSLPPNSPDRAPESPKSSVLPGEDSRRSALLVMFKKESTDMSKSPVGVTLPGHHNANIVNSKMAQSGPSRNTLMQRLEENRTPSTDQSTQGKSSVRSGSHSAVNAMSHRNESTVQQHPIHQAARTANQPPNPPGRNLQLRSPRILQRGQKLEDIDFSSGQQHASSAKASPLPSQTALPIRAGTIPAQDAGGVGVNRKTDVPHDQKLQLLSLFGKQSDAVPEVAAVSKQPAEPLSSRVSSLASTSGDAPISPIQQDIFLSYLQSVTKNAR